MLTTRAYFLPAVPTMLIDEQRGDVTEMIEALVASGERLAAEDPDVIVALSPRWVSPGPFGVDDAREHRSMVDLPTFGVEPRYDCPGHQLLARAIVEFANKAGVRSAIARHGADSAVSIPLHFFARGRRMPVVPVSIGEGSREEHRAWGTAIRYALQAWQGKSAFVVGGAVVAPARVQPAPRGAGLLRAGPRACCPCCGAARGVSSSARSRTPASVRRPRLRCCTSRCCAASC
ncbi:MAG: hypothetical protein IPJ04_03290 [Candidatus Eisenbacteria bacterium]|nr:hypothetical protein [Candidatus Eisenbacteria bacterium]